MTIRKARQDESSKLTSLEHELFSEVNYPITYGSFYYHTKNNLLYVVEIEEKLVAYILVLVKRKKANIFSLGVLPAFRGQGISNRLLNAALKEVSVLGFTHVTLEVRTDNPNAIALYKKFGFTITEEIPYFYLDGCDAYMMELTLAC
jgi:ribosomal-protein-alanine N-acetyltransferase